MFAETVLKLVSGIKAWREAGRIFAGALLLGITYQPLATTLQTRGVPPEKAFVILAIGSLAAGVLIHDAFVYVVRIIASRRHTKREASRRAE